MSLREIARFDDVYEADLAAAFLASHDIDALVTERYQTTVDPLMQRALGIRLMAPASLIEESRALLSRVGAGEFATEDGDDIPASGAGTRAAGRVMALVGFVGGGFWGNSLPRRLRPVSWQGVFLSVALFAGGTAGLTLLIQLIFYPP